MDFFQTLKRHNNAQQIPMGAGTMWLSDEGVT